MPDPNLGALLYDLRESLPMIVVTDHPTDYPNDYVARLHITLPEAKPTNFVIRCAALAPIHDILESAGLHRLHRQEGDDPAILETWL